MAKESSSQKFIRRTRPHRVQLGYDVERLGVTNRVELPFVVGVMSDLSGHSAQPLPVSERRFRAVDWDNFDNFMAEVNPKLALEVENLLDARAGRVKTELSFSQIDDFRPERVIDQVEPLRLWLNRRRALFRNQDPSSPAIVEHDQALCRQLDAILHAPEFQRLEATWRGLRYLVLHTESSEALKIKVLDISKRELFKDLDKSVEFDQSQTFNKIYMSEFYQPGGEPFGAMIGDYAFNHGPEDLWLLSSLSHLAAAAHAPFIGAASPSMFGMEHFGQLGQPRDLAKIFSADEYVRWNSFRESEDARYVGLTVPRVLLRSPYLGTREPSREFAYNETIDRSENRSFLWGNAAYTFATVLTNAFAKYYWCADIRGREGGGMVEDLPSYTFPDDQGGAALKCPTEIGLTDRREAELSHLGFMTLVHVAGSDSAAFFSTPSCHRPKSYDNPDASANARLAAQLQWVFTTSRFAHYLKTMARDGAFRRHEGRQDLERFLNEWLSQYVLTEDGSSATIRASYPLREGRVDVVEAPGKPGVQLAVVYLRPHFQLEEMSVSMRMVVELPASP